MARADKIKVLFVAGFGPIVRDVSIGRRLYREDLGIEFKEEEGGYLHTESLEGAKTFAIWPLTQAAQSCFGRESWPDEIPSPHAWCEFDVESVEATTAELESRGYPMLVKNQREPWGQTVSRFLTPDGFLIGITRTPAFRDKK